MDPDRVIHSFVVGWVVLLAVVIALDWLGNPNRGSFRPMGDRPLRDRRTRKAERQRRQLENDAAIRATLRDAYGASSMRLRWSSEQEDRARLLDDSLIVSPVGGHVVEEASREATVPDHPGNTGDPLTDTDKIVEDLPDDEPGPEPEPAPRPVGWRVGCDPLALTASGAEPAAPTIRARVWKNHSVGGTWSEENLARLRAGKPPLRVNPITGRTERATVDVETGLASWGRDPVDPFEEGS